jgi:hypothetical protein
MEINIVGPLLGEEWAMTPFITVFAIAICIAFWRMPNDH